MNNKEKLVQFLKTAPLSHVVDISLDFLDKQSVLNLLDYNDEVFEIFLTAIARPTRDEGIRDAAALATEILSSLRELRKRTISLANEATVSMEKLNKENN